MENKNEKIFIYSEILKKDYNETKEELRKALEDKDCIMIIDFEGKDFTEEQLKKYFMYLIENKKGKIITLRKILPENYKKLKFLQNLDIIKNMK